MEFSSTTMLWIETTKSLPSFEALSEEWKSERLSWSSDDSSGAFNSVI